MQVLKVLFMFMAAGAFFASCKNVEFQKTSAGVPFKVFSNKKGDSIKVNYIVKFEVIQKTKDSVLFDSYKQGASQYLQVQPGRPNLSYNDIGGNIMEIFPKVKNGDSIYIVQATDSLMKQNAEVMSKTFKKGDQVITTIKIVEVYKTIDEANAAVAKDRAKQSASREKEAIEMFRKDTATQAQMAIDSRQIEAYLAQNNIQATKTEWGAYVQVINPGTGPKPEAGKFVNVKYAGRTLKGVAFDAGEFPLQMGTGGSIKGFEEGVKQLSQGGKALVFIPSRLGYGPNGSGPKIGPNEILVFDLEILSISDTPPTAQQHYEGDGHGH
jgi:FKBP-type peptidyl-prolyl cis-trans isomerase FkpA